MTPIALVGLFTLLECFDFQPRHPQKPMPTALSYWLVFWTLLDQNRVEITTGSILRSSTSTAVLNAAHLGRCSLPVPAHDAVAAKDRGQGRHPVCVSTKLEAATLDRDSDALQIDLSQIAD